MQLNLKKPVAYDSRHPLYLGTWKRSIPYQDYGFAKDDLDEPHLKRKLVILNSHPEIKQLYGPNIYTLPIVLLAVIAQLINIYVVTNFIRNKLIYMLFVYFVGASITALYGVLIHETTHNLISKSNLVNRLTELLTNTMIPFPIAASFRRYHLDHHAYQGVVGKDPDLPMDWEWKFIKGNTFLKLIYVVFYPLMYVIRGTTQFKPLSFWEIVNIIYVILVQTFLYKMYGSGAFCYLMLCLLFGYGIHPGAAHFIQEHYTFENNQETYSYYGILNKPYMNIGYHNEHHDFMQVSWNNLPKVTQIANKYYKDLKYHKSWVMTLVSFITDKSIGPQSRTTRLYDHHLKARQSIRSTNK